MSGPLGEDAVVAEEHQTLLGSVPLAVAIPRIDTTADLTLASDTRIVIRTLVGM